MAITIKKDAAGPTLWDILNTEGREGSMLGRTKGFSTNGIIVLLRERGLMILAINIGGTKFTAAVFDGVKMVCSESHVTGAAGGRE